ncbi:MAG TPA: 2-phospho-L-lactate transferase CofD family protein, partial [Capsulimonadaceae bacterium]|nr:2-phospho-L-lactate transferase CofD family protein [Capsulimonadaceae bacterium]
MGDDFSGAANPMKRFVNWLKWLAPGMRVKRWLLLTFIGIGLVIVALLLLINVGVLDLLTILDDLGNIPLTVFHIDISKRSVNIPLGIGIALIGLACIFVSFWQVNRSIISALLPEGGIKALDLANKIYQRRTLAQGHRVVVLGGGTGLATLLRGLKQYTSNIAAIVTVTDNGGSSGMLIESANILPP